MNNTNSHYQPLSQSPRLSEQAILHGLLRDLVQHLPENGCSCGSCFAALDEFVERLLRGEDVATVMPLIHTHLAHCHDCWQEYEALIRILEAFTE